MSIFQNFLLVSLSSCVFGGQNQYRVFQENMVISEIDPKVLDAVAGVIKVNDTTNALNFTFKLKINLPADCKIYANAFKRVNGDYKLGLIKIFKTLPSALDMTMFDLQGLFVQNCRPPMVWPLQKGVVYHSIGWSPDSTKFPAHLPEGQWKVPITVTFANKTTFVEVVWYLRLIYKK